MSTKFLVALTLKISLAVGIAIHLPAQANAQISFSNSGQVSDGSSISGVLTDGLGDTIGYEISTMGPLFFGWNGDESSEPGGVKDNFGSVQGMFDWEFTIAFDSPIASISLGQTPIRTAGANTGGDLLLTSNASAVLVNPGTQGLGVDGLSNLNSVNVSGGTASANLATTDNSEDDWSVDFENVQTITVRYQPVADSPAVVGNEWLTFAAATIAVPEPSSVCLLALGGLFSGTRRRRV